MKIFKFAYQVRHSAFLLLTISIFTNIYAQNPTTQEQKQLIEQLYQDATAPNGEVRCSTEPMTQMRYGSSYQELKSTFEQYMKEELTQLNQTERQAVAYEIPIIFHIIHNGQPVGTGTNLAANLIDAQIEQLNNDFRKIMGTSGDGGGVDTEIQFCLALLDENDNLSAENGINRIDGRNVPNAGMGSPRREILASSTACQIVGDFDMIALEPSYHACQPNDAVIEFKIQYADNFSGSVNISLNNLPPALTATFSTNPVTQSGVYQITISGTNNVAIGDYNLSIQGDEVGGAFSDSAPVILEVEDGISNTPTLSDPADAATDVFRAPTLTWLALTDANTYDIEVSTDINFNTIIDSETTIDGTSFQTTLLTASTVHYWRVRGENECGIGPCAYERN